MNLPAHAQDYAACGLRVHPCRPEDKRPLTRWGTAATTDLLQIEAWWRRWPDALIAVCTGDQGVVVVDDDRGLAEPDPDLAGTVTSRTRSRGWHHWFVSDEPVGCAVGLLPGIDVRGVGGYVIAPPSPGWEWHGPRAPMLRLPAAIATAMQQRARPRYGPGFEPATHDQPVAEGGRNDYIARFAGWVLRQELAATLPELVELCVEHNDSVCRPPLDEHEVRRIAASIWRRDQRG